MEIIYITFTIYIINHNILFPARFVWTSFLIVPLFSIVIAMATRNAAARRTLVHFITYL